MSPEVEIVVSAFLGSAALTSVLIILAMIGTLNPYHRPAIPLVAVSIVILSSTYVASVSFGDTLDLLAFRNNLVNGVISIIDLFFIAFVVLTVLLLQTSLRRRPQDPLIALSQAESDP